MAVFERLGYIFAFAYTFSNNYDTVAFASGKVVLHAVCHFIKVIRHFRYKNSFST
ncbi:hypothetical protein D3C86_2258960 [compost metagenome]